MRDDEYEKLKRGYRVARKQKEAASSADKLAKKPEPVTKRRPAGDADIVNLKEYAAESKKRKKKEARKKSVTAVNVLSVCLFLLFLGYLGSMIFKSLTAEEPLTVQVVYGSVDVPIVHKGIIVREETLVISPVDGTVFYSANDGDRMKKGSVVCEVFDEASKARIEEQLEAINSNIMNLQEKRSDYSMYESDIASANSIIKKEIDRSAAKLASYDVKALLDMKEKITQTISVRNNLLLNENTGSLVGATLEKDRYEAQLSDAVNRISIDKSGIIAYKTDGLEELLTPERRFNLTKEQTEMDVDYEKILYTKEAKTDEPVFKVITSNEWYIASYIPNSVALTLEEGKGVMLYIVSGDDYEKLQMTVEKKTAGESESYIVFKSTKLLTDYLNVRTLSFKINLGITEGFKIPNTAIAERMVMKLPKEFVFEEVVHDYGYPSDCVMKKGVEENELVELNVIDTDEDYCYILQELGELKLGEILVMKEGEESYTMVEFEYCKGIYTINSSITRFRIINLGEGASSNASYTILDPKLNSSVKIDDTIISDVKKMVE